MRRHLSGPFVLNLDWWIPSNLWGVRPETSYKASEYEIIIEALPLRTQRIRRISMKKCHINVFRVAEKSVPLAGISNETVSNSRSQLDLAKRTYTFPHKSRSTRNIDAIWPMVWVILHLLNASASKREILAEGISHDGVVNGWHVRYRRRADASGANSLVIINISQASSNSKLYSPAKLITPQFKLWSLCAVTSRCATHYAKITHFRFASSKRHHKVVRKCA